ncbi:MAG: gamma carbonic anhydrase family protein [Alphaproteobacteria bacterium]|nr:gamma carbonic anhydrase family protein [Alphaproteobacteria bacterium]
MPLYPYQGLLPTLHPDAWVAPTATVIGDTHLGAGSNVWFGAVLRGDVHHIRVGDNTNIQDNAVVHVTSNKFPCLIGHRVTVGHSAVVHACTLHDECLVGMGAVVLDGAVVESGAMVAAGAVVSPGRRVPRGFIWAGMPAKELRPMTTEETTYLAWSAEHYRAMAARYRAAGIV